MFVHNLTIQVDNSILPEWLAWHKEEYLPVLLATELFTQVTFFELLELDDPDSSTFVLQHYADAKEKYDAYIDKYADAMKRMCLQKWGTQVVSFGTLMQTVD